MAPHWGCPSGCGGRHPTAFGPLGARHRASPVGSKTPDPAAERPGGVVAQGSAVARRPVPCPRVPPTRVPPGNGPAPRASTRARPRTGRARASRAPIPASAARGSRPSSRPAFRPSEQPSGRAPSGQAEVGRSAKASPGSAAPATRFAPFSTVPNRAIEQSSMSPEHEAPRLGPPTRGASLRSGRRPLRCRSLLRHVLDFPGLVVTCIES
jgi:hypothetical protein